MPKLFPIIDAIPNWGYPVFLLLLIWTVTGAIWWGAWVKDVGLGIRYEWKRFKLRQKEAAIAQDRMQAAAERYRR